jgi:hypothetical protein
MGRRDGNAATLAQAKAALAELKARLAGREGVTGVGIARAEGGYELKVNLAAPAEDIPGDVGGIPVFTEVTGPLRKR